jgi:TonB-linked SusC/RagA family outer membrane protein
MERRLILLLAGLLACLGLSAQTVRVSGVVTDQAGEPLASAGVLIKGTSTGTATDIDGRYSLTVKAGTVLEFTSLGFMSHTEKVDGRTEINVALTEDNTFLESVVVVGYGTRKRGSITGSVAGVDGEDMLRTKSENPQNMLTGRVAGVRVWQKSAEPGSFNNNFDIRGLGSPLVIIDGVPRTVEDFQRLNANDIDNVSVLKDASAAIYGLRGGNGVLLVTTKTGKEGKTEIHYDGSFTFQFPSTMPKLADAIDAMTLYNEQSMNKADGTGTIAFTEEYMDLYRRGLRAAEDWNSLVFADWAPQTQHDVSISGGTEKINYYVSFGYQYQQSFFRSGNLDYGKFNLRSNINAEIARGLKLNLNISGLSDQRNTPDSDAVTLIRNLWKQGVLFPAYVDEARTMLNYEGLDLEQNTVAMMSSEVSGYKKYRQKQFQSSASLDYDFGTITDVLKGLSAKALASFDFRYDDNEAFRKSYNLYAKDELTGEYISKEYADHTDRLTRQNLARQQLLAQGLLNYERTFGKHAVGAMLGMEVQRRKGDNYYLYGDLIFSSPYFTALTDNVESTFVGIDPDINSFYDLAYQSFIGRLNYGFDDRYLIEGQFRYDGSSKFAPGHEWGFFPSFSAGWRVSQEPWFKDISALSFINQLKFRVSYGTLGDDSALNYQWITGYTYPSGAHNPTQGSYNGYAGAYLFDGSVVRGADASSLPNTDISWQTSHSFNVGVDFEAWNGLLGITFDYFTRKRTGIFARNSSSLPTVVGNSAPVENLNSDMNLGMELEISHRNRIGDFQYGIKGMMTVTRQKYLTALGQGPYGNSYDRWRNDNLTNRYQGVQFGYEGIGRFENWEDIWSYAQYKESSTLPGDYKYLDWNEDGEINGLDEHPYAFDQTPWMNYSLAFDGSWKNLDFSILFQGSALGSYMYDEPLYAIWGTFGGGALDLYLDRWHPVDAGADPYDQTLGWVSGEHALTGHSPIKNSSFNRVSTSYLRLKSVELGYTIPKIGLRLFANAYNIFTLTGLKYVDPEHPDSDYGRLYPLNKTVTIGLDFNF